MCARLARIAARIECLQGSDVCRINGRVKTDKVWQKAAVLKYRASSRAGKPGKESEEGRMRQRSETIRSGAMTLVGWSDAVYEG